MFLMCWNGWLCRKYEGGVFVAVWFPWTVCDYLLEDCDLGYWSVPIVLSQSYKQMAIS